MNKPTRRGRGGSKPEVRPTSFKPECVEQVAKLCRLGATDAELADFFGVDVRTIPRWSEKHPEFCQALKAGKIESDMDIADRLFQRARGFEYVEEQAFKVKRTEYLDGKKVREYEEVGVVSLDRVAPPDTTAGIFWLKNRRKDQWRERQEAPQNG